MVHVRTRYQVHACVHLLAGRHMSKGMAVRSLKLLGEGAVRGSEGHPADDDDLASETGHLLAKRALFP